MVSTLVLVMTFNGAGFEPANVQAIAMPTEQCAYLAQHPPRKKGWTTVAFCTSGGDPALNPKEKK